MKGIVKGIFMLMFCVVYGVLMFGMVTLLQVVERKMGKNSLTFRTWKTISTSIAGECWNYRSSSSQFTCCGIGYFL